MKEKISNKLNRIGVKITELAGYLGVSRPTVYKIIEMYENKNYDQLKKQYFDLLRYIDKNDAITKYKLIVFMIRNKENFIEITDCSDKRKEIINKFLSLPDKENINNKILSEIEIMMVNKDD